MNDFLLYRGGTVIIHSAKGSSWKKHKYIKKIGDRYTYATDKLGVGAYKDYIKADKEKLQAYGEYAGAEDITKNIGVPTGYTSNMWRETVASAGRAGAANVASTNLQNFKNAQAKTEASYNRLRKTPIGKVAPAIEAGRSIIGAVTGSTSRRFKKAYEKGYKDADRASLESAAKKVTELKERSLKKKGADKTEKKTVQNSTTGKKVTVSSKAPRQQVKNVTGVGKDVYRRGGPANVKGKGQANSVSGGSSRPTTYKVESLQEAAHNLEANYKDESNRKKKYTWAQTSRR